MQNIQSNISHIFSYSQSYRRRDERPVPDDFSRYTETATVSKIYVEGAREIRIRNPLFMITEFRSKISLENPVQMAFFLSNESIEQIYNDNFPKLVDPNSGRYTTLINPNEPIPQIAAEGLQVGFPYRLAYFEIPEFSDFPLDSEENFYFGSTSKIILNPNSKKQIVGLYLVKSNTFSASEEILISNVNGYEFLYLIPYVQKLQKTEVAVAGRVNFSLEY